MHVVARGPFGAASGQEARLGRDITGDCPPTRRFDESTTRFSEGLPTDEDHHPR